MCNESEYATHKIEKATNDRKAACPIMDIFGQSIIDDDDMNECVMGGDCMMSVSCRCFGTSDICDQPHTSAFHIGLMHDHMNDDGSNLFLDMMLPRTVHLFDKSGVLTIISGTPVSSGSIDLDDFVMERIRRLKRTQ